MKFPSVNLIASGGHTYLVYMKNKKNYKLVGETVDDAAGEAFDKVAKMLKLPYPGGPQIAKYARKGQHDFSFPRPMLRSNDFYFSFAGLKTAVLYKIRDNKLNVNSKKVKADLAFSFQNAVIDVLVQKTISAAKKYKAKSITLSGGVAANKLLRAQLQKAAQKEKAGFYVPEFALCTDNALMIANAAALMLANGYKPKSPEAVRVNPVLEI